MIKILFVCHGNICRSPMAQFILQDMVNKAGLSRQFFIESAATSTEEIGSPPHHGTVSKMKEAGIPVLPHRAVRMTKKDYGKYDYLIGMDSMNIRNMKRILGGDPEGKVFKLSEFSHSGKDIADPWYTGDFHTTYNDIRRGCEGFLEKVEFYENTISGM